jgi:hypothetical protein
MPESFLNRQQIVISQGRFAMILSDFYKILGVNFKILQEFHKERCVLIVGHGLL